jgi:amino-acid N-acetyltransferase
MNIELCKPNLTHISSMQEIVLDEIKEGVILPRDNNEVATNIRSYTIALKEEELVGYLALHIHTPILAEIRSLVVSKGFRGKSIGSKLVKQALIEAKELKIKSVFALTYKKSFFERLGFEEIEKSQLPEQKIWADCIKCKHFPVCDEVALSITI